MSNKTENTFLAILTGVAIGAAVGILFAPDKGIKTREKLKDGFNDVKNDLGKFSETIKSKFFNSEKDIDTVLQELLSNPMNTTDEIIAILEQKLQTLKKSAINIANN